MSLVSSLTKAVKGIAITALKKNAFNFIDLETPVTDDTFLTKSGSLVTFYEYKGLNRIPGNAEIERAMNGFAEFTRELMSRGGSSLSIVIERNDSKTVPYLEDIVKGQRRTAKRLNIDAQDIIDSDVEEIAKHATYRKAYIVLWTHMSSYTGDERKDLQREMQEGQKEHRAKNPGAPNPIHRDSVNPSNLATGLLDKHEANLNSLSNALDVMDARARVLPVSEAARAMKAQIEVDTPENWSPIMLGGEYIPSHQEGGEYHENLDDLLYPRLDEQISVEPHDAVDSVVYEVAGQCYMSLFVSAWGRDIKSFHSFEKALPKSVPYRVNFLLNPGVSGTWINNMLGPFTYWMHGENKKIKAANEFIGSLGAGDAMQMQVVITTTGETKRDVRRNVEAIKTAITEWGSTKVSVDPVSAPELYVCSAVGASATMPVESGLPTPADVGMMAPLYSPSSQWDHGTMLFTTTDGRIMPFEPGSAKQEANSTAIIARPRMGKSVLANAMMKAFCLKGGLTRLPLYTSIDIGGSTDGAISMIEEAMPPDQKHLVRSYQLQMDPLRYTKNIMDLPLGAAKPLPMQRNMIEQMLLMMVTTAEEKPVEGMVELVSQLVSLAYSKICGPEDDDEFSTADVSPIEYTPGISPIVDRVIDELKLPVVHYKTTMRQVRDMLFDAGRVREAEIAQRFMVPSLDMLPALTSEGIIDRTFGEQSKFDVIDTFNAKLYHAQNQYPILFGRTTFDTAGARVLSIDLTHVTDKDDTGEALKQNTLMYGMAIMLGTQNFFYTQEHARFFERRYRPHAERMIDEYAEDEKVLQMDEYHRASPSPQIRQLVKKIELEGPKTKCGLTLISQEVEHFHRSINNFSNIFILGQLPQRQIQLLDDEIGLTESEKSILKSASKMHGPRIGGSSLLHRATVNEGTVSQLLRFAKGPVGLWGLATSQDDRSIRRSISAKLGGPTSRRVLAKYFPVGTIKSEIDLHRKDFDDIDEEQQLAIIKKIEDQVLANAARDRLI